jgi:hypothetical protein
LTLTKEAIDNIFRKSGIRLAWTDCPPVPSSVGERLCRDESVPGEVRVRIVDRQLKHYVAENAFGFAIPPVWATVYYEPALRLARSTTDSESNVSIILGCLIAHEIGHLLLGKDQHTASGIMMARWDIQQIQQVMKGTLGFSRQQAERMRMNAQRR